MVNDVKNYSTIGSYVASHKKEVAQSLGMKENISLWGEQGLVNKFAQKSLGVKSIYDKDGEKTAKSIQKNDYTDDFIKMNLKAPETKKAPEAKSPEAKKAEETKKAPEAKSPEAKTTKTKKADASKQNDELLKEIKQLREIIQKQDKRMESIESQTPAGIVKSAGKAISDTKNTAVKETTKAVKAGAGGTGAALGNFGEFFKVCADGLKGFAQGFTDYANSK